MMERLELAGPGDVRFVEVETPEIDGADAAIVRPLAVATCDIDVAVLSGRYPVPGAPYPFGHESVAEVLEVGSSVGEVAVGDRVVVPFQISCGSCDPCRQGRTGNCSSNPPMSTYGLGTMGGLHWGGHVSDRVVVPHADAMLVPLPPDVSPVAAASCSDNIPDAWRTVGPQLDANPGADVLVVGGDEGPHSIGLYAAGLAVTLGAAQVVYADTDVDRLARAEQLGAEALDDVPARRVGSFPITVDASGNEAGLHCALHSTASDGVCTSPSVYLADPPMPLLAMYSRCCTFHTGRAHVRPAIPRVLEAMRQGFDPTIVTTAVVPWDSAAEALTEPSMKMILDRSGDGSPPSSQPLRDA